jgi:hypothetical protein
MLRKVIPDPVAMERDVKFGVRFFLAIVLAGAAAAQPGFAKTLHPHRAAAKGEDAAHAPIAKDAHSDSQTRDSNDADNAVAPSHPNLTADRPRGPNVNAKIGVKDGTPGIYQVRREPVPASSVPRNSIGVALAPQRSITASSGGNLRPATAPPVTAGIGDHDNIGGHPDQPDIGFKDSRPVATASIPSVSLPSPTIRSPSIQSRGKIDGSSLIRASVAPSGLGGPAKTVAGINGTTLRPKH